MTEAAAPGPATLAAATARRRLAARGAALRQSVLPVLGVIAALIAFWYLACIPMNAAQSVLEAARAGAPVTPAEASERRGMSGLALAVQNPAEAAARAYGQERPRLPAPHQIGAEVWAATAQVAPTSPRSLLYHGWVTLSATLLGFAFGAALGVLLAMGIVQFRVMDLSVMLWAIVSQTVPIIAIAPMVIVVLHSVGISGIVPKAAIAAWLSFFPVVVGMVKGLRSPDAAQLDLLKTYGATARQTFLSLRLPGSTPYLFASLKIAVAAALVGTIVAELPTGAQAGFGARLLAGSYYGQTVQIWSALVAAAVLAALLVALVGAAERLVLARMGLRR
ncbi:ABC transporter permease [Pseudoroseicyclus aestuarii]|uniref:NitT/TauT family transport system permease protein n=1 Tax=Pseudoroseicyclus aestuarii TaxID=1795041 RepID=A0A318SMB0_9RHOB|nr:ABC transporter permease subunit [Pseudoroseicyclus aestuarii]PYE81201.1 NitT/TauT family transport system permease protein [Pseudoroseicyclus aestuarii]